MFQHIVNFLYLGYRGSES
eukprot:UN18636